MDNYFFDFMNETDTKIAKPYDFKDEVRRDGFVVKDSGVRQVFSGGMQRDTQEGKVDWWRIYIGPLLERWATHVTKAATKYPDVAPGVPNWTLAAGEEEMFRFKASAARHFAQFMRGDTDEDHLSATCFNLNGYAYCEEKLKHGR